jgi:DNA-binding winged helix-turn-helix (wHTH) protein
MEQVVVFGVFEADLQSGEIRKQGRRVSLQQQPFAVLKALVSRPNQLVSRNDLRQLLWPSDVAVDFDQSLNKCVTKVRDAIGDSATNPRFIETLPKRGYRFIAPVTVRAATQAAAPLMGLIVGDPLCGQGRRSWSLASIRD